LLFAIALTCHSEAAPAATEESAFSLSFFLEPCPGI